MEDHHLRTRREGEEVAQICRECHKTIHGLFKHRELRDERTGLATVEGLRENDRFAKALTFIRKVSPGEFMRMRESRARRRRKR